MKWRETQINSTKIKNKRVCPLSQYVCNIVLEVLARALKQLKEFKVQTLKGKIKNL